MLVSIPDHYLDTISAALVRDACNVLNDYGYVPGFLHQYADTWDKGLRYGTETFWQAVYNHDSGTKEIMERTGIFIQ